jgi:hypothetical protein
LSDVQMIVFHQQRSSFLSCPPLHSSRTHATFEPRSLEKLWYERYTLAITLHVLPASKVLPFSRGYSTHQ